MAALFRLLVFVIVATLLLVSVAVAGAWLTADRVSGAAYEVDQPLPAPLEDAVDATYSQPSVVFARDGGVMGRFRPKTLHVPMKPSEIPATVATAVVAAEDKDFRSHRGFDLSATTRAVVSNLRHGKVVQGGSTITQQLVKNLYTDATDTMQRKLDELRLALKVESEYSKDEILAAYLNTVFFGENTVGIKAAARTYFGKPVGDLTLSEASLLAGVIPAPTRYNPRTAPEQAEARRLQVLDRVESAGLARPADVDAARAEVPTVRPRRPSLHAYPYFMDYVRRHLVNDWGIPETRLYGGGFRIETTVDPRIQHATALAVSGHLRDDDGPSGSAVVLDPATGEVAALIGGRSWEQSKVNLALGRRGGGSGRQTGSSFKPFVLATAYRLGASPLDVVPAPEEYRPVDAEDDEVVHNYSQRGYGEVTIAEATRRSINTAYMGLTEFFGPRTVAATASALGIELPHYVGPSIGIGAYEASPLEMASAYAAFANGGYRIEPTPIRKVMRPDGSVVAPPDDVGRGPRILRDETTRLVTATLVDVINRGTGTAARIGRPAAGKTGTTDNYTNAWFVGYTPHLVTAVWVGHAEGNVAMRNVAGVDRVTGGSLPAQIWATTMRAASEGLPPTGFPPAPHRPPATTTTTTTTTNVRP